MKEAAIESKKGAERGVTARSVKKVTPVRAKRRPLSLSSFFFAFLFFSFSLIGTDRTR